MTDAEQPTGAPERPETIGSYRVLDELGAGGMGRVYGAVDTDLDRHVAIKTLLPELATDPIMSARFLREARAMAKVSSPHVVTVFQVGEDDGVPYLVMERLEGQDLSHYIAARGRIPEDEALSITRDAVLGLDAAFAAGHVHRDVKPANLFVVDGGVKLTDFGLARPVDGSADVTQAGLVVGTPHYLAPELARGKEASVASDVYALGATLFAMLAGRPPFEGDAALEVLTHQLSSPVPDLRRMGISHPAAQLVEKMLAKTPEERFSNYDELLAVIDDVKSGGASVPAQLDQPTLVEGSKTASGTGIADKDTVVTPKQPLAELDTQVSAARSAAQGDAASAAAPAPGQDGLIALQGLLRGPVGVAAAAVVLAVGVVFALGDSRLGRIDDGEAAAVLKELDAIPDAEWSAELDFVDGYARFALEDDRAAMRSYLDAVKGGFSDDRMIDHAMTAFETKGGAAAEDLLAAWPSDGVESEMRDLLEDDSWARRDHALGVLEAREVATDEERQKVGMRHLKSGGSCAKRRAGLRLLRQAGRGEAVIEAIRDANRDKLNNICMAIDIPKALGAVKRRTEGNDG